MPAPCRVSSLGCTTGVVPEQGLAKLQEQLAGKGVRRRTEAAQEEEEGKGAKNLVMTPPKCPTARYY